MQERVTAGPSDNWDVIIQFGSDLDVVGVGLEPKQDSDAHHFIDTIYGDVSNLAKIGKLFYTNMHEVGLNHEPPDFTTSDAEEEWYAAVGRHILDSVTGSTPASGMWTWLSRPASNRLIRLIRKGRDASFGRDE